MQPKKSLLPPTSEKWAHIFLLIYWLTERFIGKFINLFIYLYKLFMFLSKELRKKQRAAKAEWKYGSTFWCSLKATLSTLHPTPKTHLIKCIYSTWAQFMIWNKWSVINHNVHLVFIYLLLIHILSIIKYGEQNYVLNVVTVFT